eukprot:447807_1
MNQHLILFKSVEQQNKEIMEQLIQENLDLRKKLLEAENKIKKISKISINEDELDRLLNEIDSDEKQQKQQPLSTNELLKKIENGGSDHVKELIVNGKINQNSYKTLLMKAAELGEYNLTQILCESGANKYANVALLNAKKYNNYHIQQYLYFQSIGASMGTQIKTKINEINTQNCIIEYLLKTMNKKIIEEITGTVINAIKNRAPISDDFLVLTWIYMEQNTKITTESELFKTVMFTIENIFSNQNKTDWSWFNKYLLKSNIWVRNYTKKTKQKSRRERLLQGRKGNQSNDKNQNNILFDIIIKKVKKQNEIIMNGTLQKELSEIWKNKKNSKNRKYWVDLKKFDIKWNNI